MYVNEVFKTKSTYHFLSSVSPQVRNQMSWHHCTSVSPLSRQSSPVDWEACPQQQPARSQIVATIGQTRPWDTHDCLCADCLLPRSSDSVISLSVQFWFCPCKETITLDGLCTRMTWFSDDPRSLALTLHNIIPTCHSHIHAFHTEKLWYRIYSIKHRGVY